MMDYDFTKTKLKLQLDLHRHTCDLRSHTICTHDGILFLSLPESMRGKRRDDLRPSELELIEFYKEITSRFNRHNNLQSENTTLRTAVKDLCDALEHVIDLIDGGNSSMSSILTKHL